MRSSRSYNSCAFSLAMAFSQSLFSFFFPSLDKHVLSAGTCSCIERATKSAQKGKKAGMEESREWLSVSRRIVYKNEEFCSFDIISKPVLGERRWCAVVQVEEYFLVNFCYCEKVATCEYIAMCLQNEIKGLHQLNNCSFIFDEVRARLNQP